MDIFFSFIIRRFAGIRADRNCSTVTPLLLLLPPRRSVAELFCGDTKQLLLSFEIARVLVRLDHVASVIINADHSIV